MWPECQCMCVCVDSLFMLCVPWCLLPTFLCTHSDFFGKTLVYMCECLFASLCLNIRARAHRLQRVEHKKSSRVLRYIIMHPLYRVDIFEKKFFDIISAEIFHEICFQLKCGFLFSFIDIHMRTLYAE